jgi:phospholipid N-methyltransferase
VDAGADWTIADTGGRVAVQMAKELESPNCLKILEVGPGRGMKVVKLSVW